MSVKAPMLSVLPRNCPLTRVKAFCSRGFIPNCVSEAMGAPHQMRRDRRITGNIRSDPIGVPAEGFGGRRTRDLSGGMKMENRSASFANFGATLRRYRAEAE